MARDLITDPAAQAMVLFSSPKNQKLFQDSSSHQILRHMNGTLNIDKNKKLIV
jgi:hypothetical protein